MSNSLVKINKKLLKAGKKSAEKFIDTYLENEDRVIELLKKVNGTRSEIYLTEVDDKLNDLVKFSSIFSDLTFLNTTDSAINEYHVKCFTSESKYARERQLIIPPKFVNEIGTDVKRFLPCYIYRNDTEVKKLCKEYNSLILTNKLLIRPLRGLYVKSSELSEGTIYYVDPNTENSHWYINDVYEKQNIIIDNGFNCPDYLKLFELTLPYFDGIDIDKLSQILLDESDILFSFRVQLKKLINEAGDNLDRLKELQQDIIRPAIETLERKFTKISNTHRLTIGATVGSFSISLILAVINNNLLQVLTSVLPAAASGIIISENSYQDKLENLKDNPYYLLWKIQRSDKN